jgi:hypothetical protein
MEFIFKVVDNGYYTNLEDAVKVGKNCRCDILKVILNKESNFQEEFLYCNTFNEFVYFTYQDNTFYDPQDAVRLQEENEKEIEAQNKKFEEKKKEIFKRAPKLGWCDYPEQFAEKCPSFKGVVKFLLIKRKNSPKFLIRQTEDYSSKHVENNYYAEYIGNYDIEFSSKPFSNYDGKTTRYNGAFYPKIDEIWQFETDRYPFGNFLFDYPTLEVKVENGKIMKYEGDREGDSD